MDFTVWQVNVEDMYCIYVQGYDKALYTASKFEENDFVVSVKEYA